MINIVENKVENIRLSGYSFKNRLANLEVSSFAQNIYELETVTSGVCYIEDLIFLENNLV